MAKKKNRRQTEACVIALKDIFLEDILSNQKLTTFYNNLNSILNKQSEGKTPNSSNISDEQLLNYYIEDFIHKKYFELIEIIEDLVVNDPLKAIKKKFMNILLEMLTRKPEREEKLLEALINKLGDPEVEIVNSAMKLLNDLQSTHSKMSLIIIKNVQNFITKSKINNPNNANVEYYSLVYLCGMEVVNDKEFIEFSLNYFFDLFNYFSKLSEEQSFKKMKSKFKKGRKKFTKKKKEEVILTPAEKLLSLIVKRVNKLCIFSEEKNIQIKKFLDEKIDTLFKLSHSESIKLRIEVLRLIFTICQGIISGKTKKLNPSASDANLDRYYKSLYDLILSKEIFVTKNLRDLLKLIVKSLTFDQNITRVAAFVKRLLQMSMHADPSFITCVLIIVSQVVRNRIKLWKMVDKNSFLKKDTQEKETSDKPEKGDKGEKVEKESDLSKRDPKFTHADILPLAEITILTSHYHPTVQKFSRFILDNYNKDVIDYNGDPLIDFSLVNFLEKFMLKNPKHKKEKKERNIAQNDDEELKRFLQEDDEDLSNNNFKAAASAIDPKDKFMQIDFISKFNEIEKTKSVKYEINQIKKEKKKHLGRNEEEFADRLIDAEYAKYDKDVDDDDDDDMGEGENEEEMLGEDDEGEDFEGGFGEENDEGEDDEGGFGAEDDEGEDFEEGLGEEDEEEIFEEVKEKKSLKQRKHR